MEVRHLPADQLRIFCRQVFERLEVPAADAALVAETLVEADLRGVASHGVSRVPSYVARLCRGGMPVVTEVIVLRDGGSTLLLDGNGGIGQVVAARAMEQAIARARERGVGVVGVRNSSHFGAAAYYAMMALPHNCLGFVFSNSSPSLAPWGSVSRILGENPWAVAVPAGEEDPIVLDLANSVVARGKIRLAAQQGQLIPREWAANAQGEPTDDPHEALAGFLLPIGGYKGSGISIVWDLLCGALMGSGVLDEVGSPYQPERAQRVGHVFLALSVAHFADVAAFKRRVDDYVRRVRSAERAAGVAEILLPGQRGFRMARECAVHGIPLSATTLDDLRKVSHEVSVRFPF